MYTDDVSTYYQQQQQKKRSGWICFLKISKEADNELQKVEPRPLEN